MNAKKKLIEFGLVVLCYISLILILFVASASAQPFPYTKATAREIDFNYFEVNITTDVSYTPQQIANFIDNYSEKSPNIIILSATRTNGGYLVYGSLKNYSIRYNKLFNPWFNASWEKRIIYNMSNIEYRKVVNMSNGDGIVAYNKSDRWFNLSDMAALYINNYTLIEGQPFVHIQGNLNGNTQWVKYVNASNSYPGVENASLTYNFYDNVTQSATFNTTKWGFNAPFMSASVVGDHLQIDCNAGCDVGRTTIMQGNENLTQFSNMIFVFNPYAPLGTGGEVNRNGDFSVIPLARSSAWVRNDDIFNTGTASVSSSDAITINTAKQKFEINRTPYWNRLFINDTFRDNKTTNIYNGEAIPFFTPYSAGNSEFFYSVIGYNRSANATFTEFQTLTYQPMNFTSWSNNKTNDMSLSITTTYPNTVRFNASASNNCDNCSWYVNGVPYTNFTLLKETSLNLSFVAAGISYINLTAKNDTFSNIAYLNWTVTAFNPPPSVNLDGFVNNTLGAYVDGVRVDLINTTGTGPNFTTWSQNHLLSNTTNLAPTIEPSAPGTGERVINVTYWANNSDVEVLAFAHGMSVSETAGVFVYIDDVFVAGQSGRPLAGAETAYREITITIPRYSSYRINFSNYHHYEWRESPQVSGYYAFKNVPSGNYTLLFQQVAYDNLTHPITLTANTRYNATISPMIDDDTEPMSMGLLGFVIGIIALALIIKHRKLLKHDGVH